MDGSGGFVFLLVLGVVILLSHLIQNAARRESRVPKPARLSDGERLQGDAADAEPLEAHPRRPKPRFASRVERTRGMRGLDPPRAAGIPARQLFAGRENLRRAVIVMTVLGPPVSERPQSSLLGSVPKWAK